MSEAVLVLGIFCVFWAGVLSGGIVEMRHHMQYWHKGAAAGMQDHHDAWCVLGENAPHPLVKPSAMPQSAWDDAAKHRMGR